MCLPVRFIILLFMSLLLVGCLTLQSEPSIPAAEKAVASPPTPARILFPTVTPPRELPTSPAPPLPAADQAAASWPPQLYREALTITRPVELVGYQKTLSASLPAVSAIPVAHPIPPEICAPYYRLTDPYNRDCAQKIEALQIAAGITTVTRQGPQLVLTLANGTVESYTDTEGEGGGAWASYSYINYLLPLHAYLLHIQYYEGSEYLLVRQDSGEKLLLPSAPIMAPDERHFFTLFNRFENPLRLSLWQISDQQLAPRLQLRFEPIPLFNGPQTISGWMNATTMQITTTTQISLPSGLIAVTVTDADVKVTYNGHSLVEPLLDTQQIRHDNYYGVFAIEPAAVGKTIYHDRDYVFTELPKPLRNQLYFQFDNQQMHDNTGAYVKFHLYHPATLYVAIDAAACQLPAWLSDWSRSDLQLATSDINLTLYQKQFPAGDVVLGGNVAPPASCIRSHYLLVVAQDEDQAH